MALEPDYDTRNSQGASALEWETHKVFGKRGGSSRQPMSLGLFSIPPMANKGAGT